MLRSDGCFGGRGEGWVGSRKRWIGGRIERRRRKRWRSGNLVRARWRLTMKSVIFEDRLFGERRKKSVVGHSNDEILL